jgi:uncharacterized membrane protein (DUF4010 family)
MDYAIVKSLLIALALGFAIGMQRSLSYLRKEEASFAGSRTFALIALAGYLSGWLGSEVPGFVLVASGGMALLIALSYALKVLRQERWGMTTQMAALLTFALGLMIRYGWVEYAVFVGVLVILLLEIKPRLRQLERHIAPQDIQAVILLLVMSFVILPMLPDRMIGPGRLFNPYQTWLMAVIIAGISFVGYLAVKFLGAKHGVLLTGAAGGLISSTAVSISLSKMYDRSRELRDNYAAGIAIACAFMYLRVLFEAFIVHPELAVKLSIPYLAAAGGGLVFSYILYRKSVNTSISWQSPVLEKNPLQLSEAIKFGLLFGIVYGAIAFVRSRYGDVGVFVVSFLSGITDVDAITLSLSQLNRSGELDEFAASVGIVTASVTNSLVKLGIAYWLGGKRLGLVMTRFFLLTLGLMVLGLAVEVYLTNKAL